MGTLREHNPLAVTVYFLAVVGIAMFTMDPVLLILSLGGALALFFAQKGGRGGHWFAAALFAAATLAGPVLSHNGVTVLFVFNRNPVTLEALLYGAASSCMIVSVLYWFRCFTQIMTSDKLLYVFGGLSPKLALILSMSLRYVPLFRRQARQVNQTQKALGLYKQDNIADTVSGGLRVFSILLTWGLENGIITADSMAARGYGTARRTYFSVFRFRRRDGVLLAAALVLAALTLWGASTVTFTYYPALTVSPITPAGLIGYAAYGLLILLPALLEAKEALQWHCLRSKI